MFRAGRQRLDNANLREAKVAATRFINRINYNHKTMTT